MSKQEEVVPPNQGGKARAYRLHDWNCGTDRVPISDQAQRAAKRVSQIMTKQVGMAAEDEWLETAAAIIEESFTGKGEEEHG